MTARRLLAFAAAVLLFAEGCGYQARKEQAEYLAKAPARLRSVGSLRAKLSLEIHQTIDPRSLVVPNGGDLPADVRNQIAEAAKRPLTSIEVPAGVNFSSGRAELLGTVPTVGEIPIALYDGTSLFVRRFGRGSVRRPWIQVDYAKITQRRDPPSSLPQQLGIDPRFVIELVAGALSGSVHKEGVEPIAGVQTTRYRLNLDWDKALSDEGRTAAGLTKLSRTRTRALERTYEQMAISDTIIPAELWVDAKGLPRKIEVNLRQTTVTELQTRKRHLHFVTTVGVEVTRLRAPVDISPPSKQERIRVDGLGELIAQLRADAASLSRPTIARRGSGPPRGLPSPPGARTPPGPGR